MKKKIYIGCSLTQAPQEFRDQIESLKAELRKEYEVLEFLGLEKGTALDVHQYDIHNCVTNCDLFVAICDLPAIGLGWELSYAVEVLKKPVLVVAHKDIRLTRLLLGASETHPCLEIRRYSDMSEIHEMIRERIAEGLTFSTK